MASSPNVRIPVLFFLGFVHILLTVSNVMSGTTIHFEGNEIRHTVLERENVSLVCKPSNTSSVNFYTIENYLVQSGRPVQGLSDDFEFDCNEISCTLKIIRVQMRHAGEYSCSFPPKSLVIDVAYSPHLNPVCSSSYNTNTFFLDSSQVPFNFSCRSEEGHPPINMTLSLLNGNGHVKSLMMSSEVKMFRSNEYVSILYSTSLNASFDNVSLLCDVNQQLPTPYYNYTASCKYGTLTLPSFTISIYPPHYTVSPNEETDITLTCKSNLTGVTLEWTDNKALQSITEDINATTIKLNINDYVATESELLLLQCRGYYGQRTAYANIIIDVASNDSHMISIGLVLVLVGLLVIVAVVIFIFMRMRKVGVL